jgi:hypothetical protein
MIDYDYAKIRGHIIHGGIALLGFIRKQGGFVTG